MSGNKQRNPKKRIVIFASGTGTNAQNIIRFFNHEKVARVVLVLSNRRSAAVLDKAVDESVEAQSFTREDLYENGRVQALLQKADPDLVVLAGFLLKFPADILNDYKGKVINIHPALLPKYGGKGMYGQHVHEAVLANNESQSGITIHYVNEQYDEGAIIFQMALELDKDETPASLAGRIHQLEHTYFPLVIKRLLDSGPLNLPLKPEDL
jgi:phosphoribosylglycinamide formyltransferase-1